MHRSIPVGHHDAQQMSELLGFKNKLRFYKKLRELGWLIVDVRGVKHGMHNQPKKEIVQLGYAYSMPCSYGTGTNKEFDREYYIPIFTQAGLEALKKILVEGQPIEKVVPPIRRPSEPASVSHTPANKNIVEEERAQALRSLREMGIF